MLSLVMAAALTTAPAQSCPTCPTAGARVGGYTETYRTTERHSFGAGPVLGGRLRFARFALPHPVRRVLLRPWAG